MGCDIHSTVQIQGTDGVWRTILARLFPPSDPDLFIPASCWNEPVAGPFDWRYYGMFAFLAGVRNSRGIIPISAPRGLPDGVLNDEYTYGDHSFSHIYLKELVEFNYSARASNEEPISFIELLGPMYFRDICIMRCLGDDDSKIRVVFGFDS